jgi:ABC-2 type transport system ATP-binding protein
MTAALLSAKALRITVDGVVAVEHLDLETRGRRLALVGDVEPLLSLLLGVPLGAATLARAPITDRPGPDGIAAIAGGSLHLVGLDVNAAHHVAAIGAAPCDPPLSPDWTAREYVTWCARLGGLGRASGERATRALETVGLGRAEKRPLRTFSIPEQRALVLAGAAVTDPKVLVVEEPLRELDGPAALFVSAALAATSEGRGLVVSLRRITPGTPEGQLAATASDLAFVSRGELLLAGDPSQIAAHARLFGLTVRSNAEGLRAELAARGIELRGGPLRFSAALPEGRDTRDILAAASAARSAVVELLSLM